MRNVNRIILLSLFWFTAVTYGQVTATPVFTLPTGTYTMPTSTTITDSTTGASILWCFTGSGTCTPATAYSGSIYVDPAAVDILCANATASGFSQSPTICATYTAASSNVAAPPTFSPAAGSYSGTRSVTLSTTTAGANIYYTTDGSTPDYTSTLYAGPILVSSSATLKAIAGFVYSSTAGTGSSLYETSTIAQSTGTGPASNWKKPDCQSPGTSFCTSDNPGGSGVPASANNPQGSPTGLVGCPAGHPGAAANCMTFSQTPATTSQTNVLWPRSGGFSSSAAVPTYVLADFWVLYPTSNGANFTCENDSQIFDPSENINWQWGNQVTGCVTNSPVWDVGGTSNTSWIAAGITPLLNGNTWHHIRKLDWRNPAEGKICSSGGTSYYCEHYGHWIIDGVSFNMQASGMCAGRPSGSGQTASPPTTGCTITTDTLEAGFGANATDQHQEDTHGATSQVSGTFDAGTFTAFYDPSAVATAAYTISNLTASVPLTVTTATPTLVSAYLTTPGSVNTMTVGGTLQFSAFCHYSSGPDLNCTVADIYGDAVTVWSSSNTALATVGAVGSANPGLVRAVAGGAPTIQATIGSTVTPAFGLTLSGPAVTLTGLHLATTGGVTGLFVGSTNQLVATCIYSDSSTTNCTSTDSHGNVASSYASSVTGYATVNATTGLVTGVAAGTTNLTAHAGSFTSLTLGLTVVSVPSGVYSITIIGPVQFSGTVTF
jgi:hypothetical protein